MYYLDIFLNIIHCIDIIYSDNLRSHKYKFVRGVCIQLLKNEIDDYD